VQTTGNPAVPSPAEVWSTGSYAEVADRMIPRLGARLVELAGVTGGSFVLDVAAGSGNVSLPAAATGASVTALDITPELVEVGEARSRQAGLEIAWVLGDAQALQYPDASFDFVLSCVGVQFCADPQVAGAELGRVCRSGGVIAVASWTPEGFIGRVLAAIAAARGNAPRRPGPLDWGREEGVAELLGRSASEFIFYREQVQMPAASSEDWVDYMAEAYGPMVKARAALDASHAWQPLREQLIEIADAHGAPHADGFAARAEYLTAVVHR
jgi:ubiquinone/menaquinone biosynthesis C-methylase UbiE